MFVSYIFYLFPTSDYWSRNGVTLNEELDGVAEAVLEALGRKERKDNGAERQSLPFSQY